jgi:hypothetical protein
MDRAVGAFAPRGAEPASADHQGQSSAGDRVELSERARFLDLLRRLPEVRMDLIARARGAIADGDYVTDEKIGAAIERLIDELAFEDELERQSEKALTATNGHIA